jgi:HEPN domain-containing protein
MNDELKRFVQQWIEKADEDRLVVHQLIGADSTARGAIGFHCQQAAEKYLKAFLIFHHIEPERTHNLEFLLERCAAIDTNFSDIDPLNLTDYGVEVRYPGDFLEPSIVEIYELISIVNQIREKVMTGISGKN